jgi:hypothetical protein
MSFKFYPDFIPIYRYMVSGVSPTAGQKNDRSNRKRKLISDRINRMYRIEKYESKINPDNPVNPV